MFGPTGDSIALDVDYIPTEARAAPEPHGALLHDDLAIDAIALEDTNVEEPLARVRESRYRQKRSGAARAAELHLVGFQTFSRTSSAKLPSTSR